MKGLVGKGLKQLLHSKVYAHNYQEGEATEDVYCAREIQENQQEGILMRQTEVGVERMN